MCSFLTFSEDMKDSQLIYSQVWKLWLLAFLFLLSGVFFLLDEKIASFLGVKSALIVLTATFVSMATLLLSIVLIRCPECGKSLVWFTLKNNSFNAWLEWLIAVEICPVCGHQEKKQTDSL